MRWFVFSLLTVFAYTAGADVVMDGTRGTSGAITPTNGSYAITEAQGEVVGKNLFHSFSTFDINAGETANFSATSNVQNVVARVTGGSPSNINGTIASDIPNANIWFLNPKGILFGKDAAINIKGSFFASTGDYLKLENGLRYYADQNNDGMGDAGLADVSPVAFGFVGDNASTPPVLSVNEANLSLLDQKTMAFAGRSVELKNAVLETQGGKISVVSVSSSGEVTYTDSGATYSAASLGRLLLDKSSFVVGTNKQSKVQLIGGDVKVDTHETDFSGNVTLLKASFFDDIQLLEKPCEMAAFQGDDELNFIVSDEGGMETFGLETSDRDVEQAKRKQKCF